jgi:cation-transporting ATPase 13A3/4/5
MLFIDRKTLSTVFITIWHLTAVWLVTLYFQSNNLLTYFLTEETLANATHVLVEKKTEIQSIVNQKRDWVLDLLKLESYFFPAKNNSAFTLAKVQQGNSNRKYIEFECVRYYYDSTKEEFTPYEFIIGTKNADVHRQKSGLTSLQAFKRSELAGKNQIVLMKSSWWNSIKEEFNSIFYIYQLMLLLTWYFYSYYFMAFVTTIMIVMSGLSVAYLARLSQAQILEMTTYRGVYRVLRDDLWRSINSEDLVPGDIIELTSSDYPLTSDCIILSGTVVVDESTLTGEALPITKSHLPNDEQFLDPQDCHLNSIYAGCKILEVKPSNEDMISTAMIVNIGARTAKGTLIRGMLFPSSYKFTFTEHLKVVFAFLIFWGIFLLFVGMAILESSVESWFFGMSTISQVLSPLLPTVLSIGQAVAGERLRKKKIACWDLNRVTVAGKVRFFCFDKTGKRGVF